MLRLALFLWLVCAAAGAGAQDVLWAQKDGAWGLVDANGRFVLQNLKKPSRDQRLNDSDKYMVVYTENGKAGVVDRSGKIIIDLVYQKIVEDRKLFWVKKNDLWGLLNDKGQWVLPLKYKYFADENYSYGGGWTWPFDNVLALTNQKDYYVYSSCWRKWGDRPLYLVKDKKGWGVIDSFGKVHTPLRYPNVLPVNENWSWVCKADSVMEIDDETESDSLGGGKLHYLVSFKAKWKQYWVKDGKESKNYYDQMTPAESGKAFLVRQKGRWGVVSFAGKEVFAPQWDTIFTATDSMAIVRLNGKWGMIDHKGDKTIPMVYDSLRFLTDKVCLFFRNGKFDVWDMKKKKIALANANATEKKDDYDAIDIKNDSLFVRIEQRMWSEYVDDDEEDTEDIYLQPAIPHKSKLYNSYKQEVFCQNEKYGLRTYPDGKVLIEPVYDHLDDFGWGENRKYVANKNGMKPEDYLKKYKKNISGQEWVGGEWSIFTQEGKPMGKPILCDYLADIEDTLAVYVADCKFGCLSFDGKLNLPPQFDAMIQNAEGYFMIKTGDDYKALSPQGQIAAPHIWEDMMVLNKNLVSAKMHKKDSLRLLNLKGIPVNDQFYQQFEQVTLRSAYDSYYDFQNKDKSKEQEFYEKVKSYFLFKQNDKWGAMDEDGVHKLKAEYDEIGVGKMSPTFERPYTWYKKDGKFGFLLLPEWEAKPALYDEIKLYFDQNALVKKDGANLLVDYNGAVLNDQMPEVVKMGDDRWAQKTQEYFVVHKDTTVVVNFRTIVNDFNEAGAKIVKKDGKFGVVDSNFKEIAPPKYEGWRKIHEDKGWFYVMEDRENEKTAIVDSFFKVVADAPQNLKLASTSAPVSIHRGDVVHRCRVVSIDKKAGLWSMKTGALLLPAIYDNMQIHSYMIGDKPYENVIAFRNDSIIVFDDNLKPVFQSTFENLTRKKGFKPNRNAYTQLRNYDTDLNNADHLLRLENEDSVYFFSLISRKLSRGFNGLLYNCRADSDPHKWFAVNLGKSKENCSYSAGLWGYVDQNGDVVIEPQFEADEISCFFDDMAALTKDELLGVINRQGKFLLPLQFKTLRLVERLSDGKKAKGGFAGVRDKETQTLLFDSTGKELFAMPAEYQLANDRGAQLWVDNGLLAQKEKNKGDYRSDPKFGLLSTAPETAGQWLVQPEYSFLNFWPEMEVWIGLLDDPKEKEPWRLFLPDGKPAPIHAFANCDAFLQNRRGYRRNEEEGGSARNRLVVEKNGKQGVLNSDLTYLVEPRYRRIDRITIDADHKLFLLIPDSLSKDSVRVVDEHGFAVLTLPREVRNVEFLGSLAKPGEKMQLYFNRPSPKGYTVCSNNGKDVTPVSAYRFDMIDDGEQRLFFYNRPPRDSFVTVYNDKMQIILPPVCPLAKIKFVDKGLIYEEKGKLGLMGYDGKIKLKPFYTELKEEAEVLIGYKVGYRLLDKNGAALSAPLFDSIFRLNQAEMPNNYSDYYDYD